MQPHSAVVGGSVVSAARVLGCVMLSVVVCGVVCAWSVEGGKCIPGGSNPISLYSRPQPARGMG